MASDSSPGFSDWCTEQEIAAFYERVYAAEVKLLQVIFGKDSRTGEVCPWWGREVAESQGIALSAFLHFECRLAWEIAGKNRAIELLHLAEKNHTLNVGRAAMFLAGTFTYNSILRASWPLQSMLAAEREARAHFATFRGLLSGAIAPAAKIVVPELAQLKAA